MKISVIIPIYNVEEYLAECLDSVILQTLQDIEIICINDGSPDNSLLILERYAAQDRRVKVISQKNKGLSIARNRGLDEATGEYVYFLDSDDYLAREDALEIMYKHMEEDNLEVLSFNYTTIGYKVEERKLKRVENTIIEGRNFLEYPDDRAVMVWLRLLKRSYLEQIDFHYIPDIMAEDDEAIIRWYYDAKRVKHVNEFLIVHRIRDNSIMTSKVSFLRYKGLIEVGKTHFELSNREKDAQYSRVLFDRGFYHIARVYLDPNYYMMLEQLSKTTEVDFSGCGLSKLDIFFIKNEKQYCKNVEIDKKNKFSNISVYIVRKFRRFYFDRVRQYGN